MTLVKDPRRFLLDLFDKAVAAADPRVVLPAFLPADTRRQATVIGAGKAAASMAAALEQHWQGPLKGVVVTRYGHATHCEKIRVVEASHPVPDDMGEQVAREMLGLAEGLGEDDLVICLVSGGGSSLLSLPADGISLADKQSINRALLKSGAAISEINCVRKHLSAVKGGRLLAACAPAEVMTFAISDVPGDQETVIASGPTVADPTTSSEALAILEKYRIPIATNVRDWLHSPDSETLKPGAPQLQRSSYHMIATPHAALQAAAQFAISLGIQPLVLGDEIEGESRDVALVQGAIARSIKKYQQPIAAPCVIISGGETTVTVKGNGRGGRNAEFLLSFANSLRGASGIFGLAADTDGIDGSENNAGALYTPDTWARAEAAGLDAPAMLENNDGYGFFNALDDLLITGPTLTNVNDFRAILVLPD